jgi:hypothetical protein
MESSKIDEEWLNFNNMTQYEEGEDCDENIEEYEKRKDNHNYLKDDNSELKENISDNSTLVPIPGDIYISTKSKIAYLNNEIDIKQIFWNIQVIPYYLPQNGVIKKQIKFNSETKEELETIKENLKKEEYFEEQVIISIDNPDGRIKFKDTRKVTVGVSKKDMISSRIKKKSAFYNCFVMILRMKVEDLFKEFHIKVFNTGKLEIPGIQNDKIFVDVLKYIIEILQPLVNIPLEYKQKCDTVLINSNFNCGFYIDREVLYEILKYKYNINCMYDPCSYPGIQCKFYYDPDLVKQTGNKITKENLLSKDMVYKKKEKTDKNSKIVEVSFMIFRTGSILIVGMCQDNVLYIIYEFIKDLLITEHHKINQKNILVREVKDKKKKLRKKNIYVTNEI